MCQTFRRDGGGWFVLASTTQNLFRIWCLRMCLPWLIFLFWLSFSVLVDDLQLSDSEESDDNQVVERPPSPLAPPRYSVLLDDLQLSDSEESDDNQVVEKPPSAFVSPRDSVLIDDLQLSDSEESDNNQVVEKPPSPLGGPRSLQSSSSESGSTSDSESSSDSETSDSESSSSPETSDSESSLGSETHHTGGVKRPGKPLVDNRAKRCRKEDSNPDPLEIRAQSSRDKQRVKKRAKPESTYRKDLKPALQEPLENRKGSQQAEVKQPFALGVKKLLSPVRDPAAPEPVRVKEEHQRRAETKDLPRARKRDLKRRAMDSPDEPSGKKKRGEI
ncbi:PREDICTED: AF4/FMR2 family member 1-like isoform X2 [Lepidothrix coronata]|uniref:AF4/FMR2 family member 1-like isoform X2 n=1 Tax=Lepidothrix coronata TaxID=321398 RepID=A0A6J0HPJ7_9PASS|nr:PREDICTED: AF4/FMR2 family member 1-like isoform X2 [Lepidothrix coronata]